MESDTCKGVTDLMGSTEQGGLASKAGPVMYIQG